MTGFTALLILVAMSLALTMTYAGYRVLLVIMGKKRADAWTRGKPSEDPAFIVRACASPRSWKRRDSRSISAATPNFWAKRRSSPNAAARSLRSTKCVFTRRSLKKRRALRVSALFFVPKIWTSMRSDGSRHLARGSSPTGRALSL